VFAEWTPISKNDLGEGYIDITTIKKYRGHTLVWLLVDFYTYENKLCSVLAYLEIDCELGRKKELQVYFHEGHMGKGNNTEHTNLDSRWNFPKPKSSAETVVNDICLISKNLNYN
jgi:hypothetical protein